MGISDAADKGQSTQGRKQVLDSFDTDIIQRCIWKLFESKSYVTIKLLQTNLPNRYDLDVKHSTLWMAVRRLGFKYRRTQSGKRYLKERQDMVASRISYLR